MTVSKLVVLFARVQPSAVIKMLLHYSDELLIINKIAKSQPQWNIWLPLLGLLSRVNPILTLLALVIAYSENHKVRYDSV